MATKSTIAIEKQNGNIDAVYCHNDGYIEYNGLLLLEHYKTTKKVKELISFGHMSSLNEKIHPLNLNTHKNKAESDVCIFYARDRDEDLEINKFKDVDDFEKYFSEEYNYLYKVKDKKWYALMFGNQINLEKLYKKHAEYDKEKKNICNDLRLVCEQIILEDKKEIEFLKLNKKIEKIEIGNDIKIKRKKI